MTREYCRSGGFTLVEGPPQHLPAIRAAALQVYDGLYFHRSWTRLLATIVFDPSFTPYRRMIRRPAASPADAESESAMLP